MAACNSLDVQSIGCNELIQRMGFGDARKVEYVDDGRAGDDFLTRSGLRQLLTDARRGDIIICRDQSRLGRDAIEVTLVVRDLVRDRGCRLYYYVTGQEVLFANAIDQATTFIQGTGHQMELEAIRSRTREALRSRVRDGRIACGACYGYRLERKADGSGRRYTVAVVDEVQAAIVRRIFQMYLDGEGHRAIAHQLNNEGIPAPLAGRRGSGSWAPSAIRTILLNARYRGVYIHGRIKKVRHGGGSVRVKAEPHETIVTEIPEWRIVDDDLWLAVQERFESRGPRAPIGRPPARYALTGIGRCEHCSGAIMSAHTRTYGGGRERARVYACGRHHQRGSAVCPVTVYQRMEDVEGALVEYLQEHMLNERVLEQVLGEIREQIAAQLPKREADVSALEAELRSVRAEQKRLAKAVALADDVPELVAELRQRAARIQHLEAQILGAKRTPDDLDALAKEVEASSRAKLVDLRAALADEQDRREAFLALFPNGLSFSPTRTPDGKRQVWKIRGEVDLGPLTGGQLAGSDRVTTRPPSERPDGTDRSTWNSSTSGAGSNRIATPTGFDTFETGRLCIPLKFLTLPLPDRRLAGQAYVR